MRMVAEVKADYASEWAAIGAVAQKLGIGGTTHKTVRRVIARHEAGVVAARVPRGHNYDVVAGLVAARVRATAGRISAKRLLPAAPDQEMINTRGGDF